MFAKNSKSCWLSCFHDAAELIFCVAAESCVSLVCMSAARGPCAQGCSSTAFSPFFLEPFPIDMARQAWYLVRNVMNMCWRLGPCGILWDVRLSDPTQACQSWKLGLLFFPMPNPSNTLTPTHLIQQHRTDFCQQRGGPDVCVLHS